MSLLRAADPRQHIVVCGKPAMIFFNRVEDEFSGRMRASSHQFSPRGFGIGTARHLHSSILDGDFPAVEIEHCAVGKKPLQAGRTLRERCVFRIHAGECPIGRARLESCSRASKGIFPGFVSKP